MECNNLCQMSDRTCEYCKKNYDVSEDFYKAKRSANNFYVIGYLVKSKDGVVQGILNAKTHFAELAYIDETTIEKWEEKKDVGQD